MTKLCLEWYNCIGFSSGTIDYEPIQNAEMNRNLTEREMQVAMACCKGKSSRIIADELGLSKRTVDSHKTNIYRKLGINNNIALIHKLFNIK